MFVDYQDRCCTCRRKEKEEAIDFRVCTIDITVFVTDFGYDYANINNLVGKAYIISTMMISATVMIV